MSNFKIYPFQKNKYFYGKLLTVRDFELEQKFNDEKRYMLNRLLYGSGIVSGLKVVMIDEQTISIEPGIAIDQLGREIVVPSPITQKLSLINGFDNNNYSKSLYLCLGYKESGKERVHAVAGGLGESQEINQYNRVQEGYEVLIKEKVEDSYLKKNIDISYKSFIVYENSEVIVKMKHPSFLNPGEVFEVYTIIEKKRKNIKVDLDFKVNSLGAKSVDETDEDGFKVHFKELIDGNNMFYQIKSLVIANNKIGDEWSFQIPKEEFIIKIENEKDTIGEDLKSLFSITEENKKERLLKEYNDHTIDHTIDRGSFDYIYLGKIDIIHVGSTYLIKKIIHVPFNQYIYNNNQIKNLAMINSDSAAFNISTDVKTDIVDCNETPDVNINYNHKLNQFKFDFKMPRNQLIFENIVTGTVDIQINDNFKFGKNMVSEEIYHGLGLGPVYIHAGIEEGYEDNISDEERIYYGASEVFYKTQFESDATTYSLGTLVYPKKGSFRIGIRLQSAKRGKTIRLRWWAYKNLSAIDQKKHVKVIINPSEILLDKGQLFQFSGIVHGNEGDDLVWSIEDENGGTIDEFGLYTAPEVEGIYKIKAVSKSDSTKFAYGIVTVKGESKFKGTLDKIKI
ncbi:MAG: hypothetical protein N4A57_02440 [Anaeromicrobium sp.]|jgi:hypothetical protein|uniref:hypothetical protein n=1 Tax=Anaeromicrobium sp. TaxID=1929132 RepID=UPI0025E00292|nr:hypothetical protein [Anaeromicrobium sp.]MCT4593120.1 hypothetical protein [Anaeromicrobium sp.]